MSTITTYDAGNIYKHTHTHTHTHTENTGKSKTNSWELAFVLCKVSMAMNTEHKVLAYMAPTRPP